MNKFNQAEFERKAKKMVASYYDIDEKEVFMVWFSKVGSNAKAMLNISDDPEFNYFNVTYFGEKGQYIMTVHSYVDDEELQLNENQESCPYCHGLIGENRSLDISPNGKAQLDMSSRGFFEYTTDGLGVHVGEHYFKYCPMCGRDLRSDEK